MKVSHFKNKEGQRLLKPATRAEMQVKPAHKPNPEIKVGTDFSTEIMLLGKFRSWQFHALYLKKKKALTIGDSLIVTANETAF